MTNHSWKSGVTAFCSAGHNSVGSAGHSFLLLSHLLRPNVLVWVALSSRSAVAGERIRGVMRGDINSVMYGCRNMRMDRMWDRINDEAAVCLSGAAVRGGRGGAARLSYRVCSSARPPARPPVGLGNAGCCRWGICLSLLPKVQP